VIALDNRITMWKVDEEAMEAASSTELPVNVFEDVARVLADASYASPTMVYGDSARASLAVVMAIYESARTGAAVAVEPARQS